MYIRFMRLGYILMLLFTISIFASPDASAIDYDIGIKTAKTEKAKTVVSKSNIIAIESESNLIYVQRAVDAQCYEYSTTQINSNVICYSQKVANVQSEVLRQSKMKTFIRYLSARSNATIKKPKTFIRYLMC